jgi:murein DD-endopeptidase MepM/ murein hydrolase activator NlpD
MAACAAPAPEALTETAAENSAAETMATQAAGGPTGEADCPDCANPPGTATSVAPMRFILPTPGAEPVSAWRPPLYPVPWALSPFDHFYFRRPIEADQVNWPIANYRYGGTFFSPTTVHTGVDIPADKGTPVHAAGAGTVVWAGWGFFSGTPDDYNDPYGIAVAIRHDFGYANETLYTLYAHLDSESVKVGERVESGDVLGRVGETGFTTGPHLHFEVRLGVNSYYHTRNPELWIAPPQGWGVLVGQIVKKNGEFISELDYKVIALNPRRTWYMRTYGTEAVQSDAYYLENTVLGDLPAGKYVVMIPRADNPNQSYDLTVEIFPGQVTFFRFQEERGYSAQPPALKVPTPKP